MNYRTLIKKLNLSEADHKAIEQAVKNAEAGTTGEIALAIAPQSDTYAFWELATAVFTAFILLLSLFPLANQIYVWLSKLSIFYIIFRGSIPLSSQMLLRKKP